MPNTRSILSVLLLVSSLLTDTSAQDSYVQITKEDEPVAYWRMEKNADGVYLNSAGEDPLTLAAKVVGTIKQTELGPTLPEFPLFASHLEIIDKLLELVLQKYHYIESLQLSYIHIVFHINSLYQEDSHLSL